MTNFRSRLKAGETLYGTMVTIPTASTAELLSHIGFDWLFVDGEHGPLESAELLAILQAVGGRAACVVRVPALDEVAIKKALDLGADGVIVPQVNSPDQAAAAVRFSRYSPDGARGVGLARAHGYGMTFSDYVTSANERISVVVQAEHIEAVENIEEIVKVEGIDAVLLGPYDLSASMGKMGQVDDHAVVQAVDHVILTCQSAGIPIGYFGVNADAVKPYIARGCSFIVAGVDTLLLGTAAKRTLSALRGQD